MEGQIPVLDFANGSRVDYACESQLNSNIAFVATLSLVVDNRPGAPARSIISQDLNQSGGSKLNAIWGNIAISVASRMRQTIIESGALFFA